MLHDINNTVFFMKNYSQKFRDEVLSVRNTSKISITALADLFGIASLTVFRWIHKPIITKRRGRCPTKINMIDLKNNVIEYPDLYLHERKKIFNVSMGGLYGALKRLNVVKKPNPDYKKTGKLYLYMIDQD